MEFYASLTINRCHLIKLTQIWAQYHPGQDFPFRRAIISPLFARNGVLEMLYQQRKRCKVMFDSGGFHVQQGRITLASASRRLRKLYSENAWANRFVLPDTPVVSGDSKDKVAQKLRSTRRQYRSFPAGFPESVRRRLLPVVHGTTSEEIGSSLEVAQFVGSQGLGFGGFATSGPNSGVNSFTPNTLRLLSVFSSFCEQKRLRTHIFGIGGPASIAVLNYAHVHTFDSAGWIRAAAYGNAYLPFVGALNVTGSSNSHRFVSRAEFSRLRKWTGHKCLFCQDHGVLMESWRHRALHNYSTLSQAVQDLKHTPVSVALERLHVFNPRFARYLQLILDERARLAATPTN